MGIGTAFADCSSVTHACTLHPSPQVASALPAAPKIPAHPKVLNLTTKAPASPIPARYAAGAALIQKLSNGQAHILHTFPAAMHLNGYSVSIGAGDRDVLFYTSPHARYFFLGGIFTASGRNLSKQYARRYLPAALSAPTVHAPQNWLSSIRHTTRFLVGNPKATKTLFMVMDPNCIFCHLTWQKLLPYLRQGTLRLQVTLVGFLKPSSAPKAATILLAKDPAKALAYDERHFNQATEEGGTVPALHIPPVALAEVQANTHWMSKNGIAGTPFLTWKSKSNQIRHEDGMPLHIRQLIRSIATRTRG